MDSIYQEYIPIDAPKNDYELFIETLEAKINTEYNEYLRMNSKLLHDSDKVNFNFQIVAYYSTKINPFDEEIEFFIEFIEKEKPYVQIISNFIRPTMYDIKNYFYCLSSKSNYIFDINSLENCQLMLEEIVSNIKYFLFHIKESESFKIFIYFGEYDINHIYHINDFLRNNEMIEFFRINPIIDDKFYEKVLYIICTEIYFIVFIPIEKNKSLGRILFFSKLSDLEFNFEEIGYYKNKKNIKKKLKIMIYEKKNRNLYKKLEEISDINGIKIFKLYDNNDSPNISKNKENENFGENIKKQDSFESKKTNKVKTNIISLNNNINNNNAIIKINKTNKFEFLFIDKNENDDNEVLMIQNQYLMFKKLISKTGILDDIGYNNIIYFYRLLFSNQNIQNIEYEKKNWIPKLKEDIEILIKYEEKLYDKYKNNKKEFDKKIIQNIIDNIIYLCTKISGITTDDNKINFYIDKMRKYAELIF